eukprot:TRINITY_DN3513_c0_g1_i1.p2 TRINITY_DN3513_c0_g1~~TRINITY_DN3513_c0_g1_i1.p2  ORF type:complete len:188 (-),score=17.01 TRINITY_DN3513_c0_g1_i1:100-663(-)
MCRNERRVRVPPRVVFRRSSRTVLPGHSRLVEACAPFPRLPLSQALHLFNSAVSSASGSGFLLFALSVQIILCERARPPGLAPFLLRGGRLRVDGRAPSSPVSDLSPEGTPGWTPTRLLSPTCLAERRACLLQMCVPAADVYACCRCVFLLQMCMPAADVCSCCRCVYADVFLSFAILLGGMLIAPH